jgi:hypothetical protein
MLMPTPIMGVLMPHQEGAGRDLQTVELRVREFYGSYHNSLVITYREALLAETFRTLADEWRHATRFYSSLEQITEHPAYRAIVELGEEIVPLLLRELRRHPEPWFAALREITGANPVETDQRGDMRAMAEAWLRWGRQHGVIR